MWGKITAYLTFTKKERLGILVLTAVVLILFVVPYFVQPKPGTRDEQAFQQYGAAIRKFQAGQNENSTGNKGGADAGQAERSGEKPSMPWTASGSSFRDPGNENAGTTGLSVEGGKAVPFYFDPNLISGEDWHRLGLPDKLVLTIAHYLQKGGRFLRGEDLKKLYGLSGGDYDRLFPYVRIRESFRRQFTAGQRPAPAIWREPQQYADEKTTGYVLREKAGSSPNAFPRKKMEDLDINLADSAVWCHLPGIGIKLASRIIHFREKLGGFYAVDQLQETFGLPDSTFRKIRPFLHLGPAGLQKIDLNNAAEASLQAHPYIRWQLAKGILQYRGQHGGFKSVAELQQLAQMEPDKFKKLEPYLEVK